MKEKTKRVLRWVGITIVCIPLLVVLAWFSIMYLAFSCEKGEIKQGSLYCYLCIDSEIRNLPLINLKGEASYSVKWDNGGNAQEFNFLEFTSQESCQSVQTKVGEHLKTINYKEKSTNSFSSFFESEYISFIKNKNLDERYLDEIGFTATPVENESCEVSIMKITPFPPEKAEN